MELQMKASANEELAFKKQLMDRMEAMDRGTSNSHGHHSTQLVHV